MSRSRTVRRLATTGVLAALVGVALPGCGGGSSTTRTSAEAAPAVDQALAHCLDSWNSSAGATAQSVAAAAAAQGNATARAFQFADKACGVTLNGSGATGTWAVRAGSWEPYLNTRGAGSGLSPARSLFVVATQLSEAAARASPVLVRANGQLQAPAGTRLPREQASSEQTLQNLDGSPAENPASSYTLNAAGWEALDMEGKIEALAAYATDRDCSIENATRIGEAIRNGSFEIRDDSLEATLSGYCRGSYFSLPSSPAPSESGDGTDNSDDSSAEQPTEGDVTSLQFETGRDSGEATSAAYCAVEDTDLECWTPNDGFTLVLPASGAPSRDRTQEARNRGREPGYDELELGGRWAGSSFKCRSRTSGLTCTNTEGRGWVLPRYRGLPSYF